MGDSNKNNENFYQNEMEEEKINQEEIEKKEQEKENDKKKWLLLLLLLLFLLFTATGITYTLNEEIRDKIDGVFMKMLSIDIPNAPEITANSNTWGKKQVVRVKKDAKSNSGIAYYEYCIVSDENFDNCKWEKTTTKSMIAATTGKYFVVFRGVSNNGTSGTNSNVEEIWIDNEAPNITSLKIENKEQGKAEVYITAEDKESGIEKYYYKIKEEYQEGKEYFILENLEDGKEYEITIRIEDKVGNSKEVTESFIYQTIDNTNDNKCTFNCDIDGDGKCDYNCDNENNPSDDNDDKEDDNNDKDDDKDKDDDNEKEIPIINLEKVPSEFEYGEKYDLPSYVSFGKSSGVVSCIVEGEEYEDTSTIEIGNYLIVCTATSIENIKTTITKEIKVNAQEISLDDLPVLRYGVLGLDYQKAKLVKKIYLDASINIPEGISAQDVSDKQDGRVVAYFVPNEEDSTKYDLHIEGNGGLYANPVSWNLFSTFSNTEEIIGAEKLNTSFMTNMQSMFSGMQKLTSVDVSTWDLSNVTTMQNAFTSTYALTSLDTSNWDLNNVTTMEWAFAYTKSLENLDATNWGLSNVVNMDHAFFQATGLKTLNTSNWDLNKVTSMFETFSYSTIESIDGSNWGLSNLENLKYTFRFCKNLVYINVSNWDLSNVTTLERLFSVNSSLTTIEGIENWDVSNVTDMSLMFSECTSLQTLNLSNWDLSNLTTMEQLFYECNSLETLDITNWDTSNVQDFTNMFFEAFNLKNIDLSKFNFASAKKVDNMFEYCNSLSGTINLNAKNIESGKNFFAFTYNQQEKRYGIEPLVINYVAETEELVDEVVNRYQYPYCRIGISEYPGYAYFDCAIKKGSLIEE